MLIWGVALLMSSQLKRTTPEKTQATSPNLLKSPSPLLNSVLLIFLIAIGIREVGSTSVSTFMTTYLVSAKNVSESIADLIFGSGVFVGIVGSLAGGYMGVRVGAKKALSLLILGSMVSLSILAYLSEAYSLTFAFLLYAFFSYAIWSPMNTIVADITPPASRGLGYSMYFFAESLVVSITPVLAAGVIQFSEIWTIFPFSIAFLLTGTIVLQLLRYPDKGRRP